METQVAGRLVMEAAGPILPRRVLVVERDWREATVALDVMVEFAEARGVEIERISRVNGDQHITFPGGGRVVFRTIHQRQDRAIADLIAVDPAALADGRLLHQLLLCSAASSRPEFWVLAGPVDATWVSQLADRALE